LPDLEEILPGLHRWTAEVADWTPAQGGPEGWGQDVACVAWEGEGALVLVDPLVEEGDWDAIDALVDRHGGPVALVVTCPWHGRSAGEAMRRYVNSPGVEAWAHAAAIRDGERMTFEVANVVSESAEVAPGVEVIATDTGNGELTVWIDKIGAIVAADVLIGAEGERLETLRVCPEAWLEEANDVETVKAALRPFLEREIAAIVPLHGAPVLENAGGALRQALA
jgi:glyoxylase-like metal-dependent hydrolase (beta-lactamase superfamily II)